MLSQRIIFKGLDTYSYENWDKFNFALRTAEKTHPIYKYIYIYRERERGRASFFGLSQRNDLSYA